MCEAYPPRGPGECSQPGRGRPAVHVEAEIRFQGPNLLQQPRLSCDARRVFDAEHAINIGLVIQQVGEAIVHGDVDAGVRDGSPQHREGRSGEDGVAE